MKTYPMISEAILMKTSDEVPATDMKQTTGDKTNAKLVRGVDEYQHFNLTGKPVATMHPDDISAVRKNIEATKKFPFAGVSNQT